MTIEKYIMYLPISCSWTVRNEYTYVKEKCAILNVMCILLNVENTDRIYRLYVGRYLREVIDGKENRPFIALFLYFIYSFFFSILHISVFMKSFSGVSDFVYLLQIYTYYLFFFLRRLEMVCNVAEKHELIQSLQRWRT